jgi:cysteinyl-tRNA synthetase
MSQATLGNKIDIHIGGVDLIFPHHENEIAQSEAKTGESPFVKYWVHGAHLLVEGGKMSKSLNNFYTLSDIKTRGFEPLALRYLYLQTHYRQEMNFTWDALEASQNALNKLRRHYNSASESGEEVPPDFLESVNEDLNFPKALSVIWDNIENLSKESFMTADNVLGLGLSDYKDENVIIPSDIQKLLDKREQLRKGKKFKEADDIRDKIIELGYKVEDK